MTERLSYTRAEVLAMLEAARKPVELVWSKGFRQLWDVCFEADFDGYAVGSN